MGGSALLSMKGVLASDSVSVIGGLERPERWLFSLSSFRNASNSRSNLLDRFGQYAEQRMNGGLYTLATKDFDVESSTIPHAYGEDHNQEGATPSGAVVQQVHRRQLRQNRIR